MSTSREWSQRHIEELIKKNGGGKSSNYIVVPGTPYINSFCSDYVYHSNRPTNFVQAIEIGSPVTIIEVSNSSIQGITMPANCKIPVKVSNSVISPIASHIITNTTRTYNYVCTDVRNLEHALGPYAVMKLAFLTDGRNTYLGYAPISPYSNNMELKLRAASNASSTEYPDRILNVINYVEDITIPGINDIEYCVTGENSYNASYTNMYPNNLSNLYDHSAISQAKFVIISSYRNQQIFSNEYKYIKYMDYVITCGSYLYDSSLAPSPPRMNIVGLRFHF